MKDGNIPSMGEQFNYLFQFYWNPRRASSAVLDHGQFLFGLIAALVVTLILSAGASRVQDIETGFRVKAEIGELRGVPIPDADEQQPQMSAVNREKMMRVQAAMQEVGRRYFGTSLRSLLVMAVVFVPVSILILALWDHLGGVMTILFRDFMPVLTGLLFAWAAAQLPFAVLWWTVMFHPAGWPFVLVAQFAAMLVFAVLGGFVLSTVMGVSVGHAMTAGFLSMFACAGASVVFSASAGGLYMFASPWLLYYAYRMFGGDVRSLGGGLRERQNFKRQLEASTLNPRDADAHYQLGLIYSQRRSFEEAEKSFRRALEINPEESEALFHLGSILRHQPGRNAEALALLERAVKIDPKLSNYEIWRELGAATLAAGRNDVALPQLEHYVSYREYDPEGLVLLGQALRGANRTSEAKAAFEKAIEAVRTAPSFRRHALKRWQSQARQELRQGNL